MDEEINLPEVTQLLSDKASFKTYIGLSTAVLA